MQFVDIAPVCTRYTQRQFRVGMSSDKKNKGDADKSPRFLALGCPVYDEMCNWRNEHTDAFTSPSHAWYLRSRGLSYLAH